MAIIGKPSKNVDVDKRKPVLVKAKGIQITIKPTMTTGKPYWLITHYASGKRMRYVLKDLEEARQRALKLIDGMAGKPGVLWVLDENLAHAAHDAAQLLEEAGCSVRLDAIVREWLESRAILKGKTSLAESCRYWVEKCGHVYTATKPAKAIESFWERKTLEGTSDRHLENIRYQCERFERTFTNRDLHTLTVPEIRAYLLGMHVSSYARRYHRNTLAMLFDHAIEHAWVPKDHNPVRKVTVAKGTSEDIAYFKPKEVRRLFMRTLQKEPDLIPYVTLACLAGIRPEEVKRMDWAWVDEDAVYLPGKLNGKRITKTGKQRRVPLCDAAKAWLEPHRQTMGPVLPERFRVKLVRRLRTISGLVWTHDALRHSFATYRLAQTDNIAKVSKELGNTIQVCEEHYANQHAKPEDAQAFFGIMPPGAEKMVSLREAQGEMG